MTIFRVQHDKNYSVINNFICKDNRLSYKAKGIWMYAFSRPDDWIFYMNDLVNQSTDGKDSVRSGLKELEDCGYLQRNQKRNEKGEFANADYIFYEKPVELKKLLPKAENPTTGKSDTVNPPLLNTDILLSIERTTTADDVFSEKAKEQIHPYIENIDIPKVDKIEITKKYDPEIIKNAIEWATHPKNPPKTCLAASIKWACQNKPEVPKNPIYEINENKSYAIKYDGVKNQYAQVYALNNCVEISYIGGQKEAFTLEYEAKGFIEQFKNALRKVQIPLL